MLKLGRIQDLIICAKQDWRVLQDTTPSALGELRITLRDHHPLGY